MKKYAFIVPIVVLVGLIVGLLAAQWWIYSDHEQPWLNTWRHLAFGMLFAWLTTGCFRLRAGAAFQALPVDARFAIAVSGAAFAGVLWEIVEFRTGMVAARTDIGPYYVDTLHDLEHNVVGGLAGALSALFPATAAATTQDRSL